jgi:lantibiotic leader peptide-processing serine protease
MHNPLSRAVLLAALLIGLSSTALMGCDQHALDSGTLTGSQANASGQDVPLTGRYMILGRGGRLPANLEGSVQAAGGRLTTVLPEIGVAFAEPIGSDFEVLMSRVNGVESVTPDVMLQYTPPVGERSGPEPASSEGEVSSAGVSAEALPSELANGETFWSFQWAPRAVQAPEAWDAGHTGQGARIAILDGAIYDQHLDLRDNLDVNASRSFVPGFNYNQDTGTFWHGTHVAGIAAAALNRIGTIGIAPNATLIGVKVLHSGSGAFEWILEGIIYAAKPLAQGGAGAHVINMSLGATIDYRSNWGDKDFRDWFRELQKAYDRGTRYAYQQGVTVVASAGNGATNFDVERGLFKFPAQNQHVISVSATGPWNWASGATDFARPAYYTDHGKSLVDLSAPGGNWGYPGNEACTVVGTIRTITNPCWAFDGIMSTVRGTTTANYNWAQGTSMAAPLVSGIAALIIGKSGGSATPAQVRTTLQRSADDLGEPGNDIWYGHGWVNAYRAVQ